MTLKTISVTYGRKINLGNYNSAEIGLSLWADLEAGDDEAKAIEELQVRARNAAKREYERLAAQVEDAANGRVK